MDKFSELYDAILEYINSDSKQNFPLLSVFINQVRIRSFEHAGKDALSLNEFFEMLKQSCEYQIKEKTFLDPSIGSKEFQYAMGLLDYQLGVLKLFEDHGKHEEPESFFGVRTEGGDTFYNLDTWSFIKCATEGCINQLDNHCIDQLMTWKLFFDFFRCGQIYE